MVRILAISYVDSQLTYVSEGMGLNGSTDYPYQTTEGNDFALNLAIPDVDFGTLHLYTADCTFVLSILPVPRTNQD